VPEASAGRGAATVAAALHKRGKYRSDIPGYVFFLLAFNTEGCHTSDLNKLLNGFDMKRATAEGWDGGWDGAETKKPKSGLAGGLTSG
jgi:hypothetical protein